MDTQQRWIKYLLESMGQKGKAMIQDHFTMEKHLETINNLIYDIG